jgi:hypothetical protein
VSSERPQLSERERVALAATLDVLWSVEAYERLVDRWGLDPKEAMAVIARAIDALTGSADP